MTQQQEALHSETRDDSQARKISIGKGLLTLAGAVVVVGSFVVLNSALAIADMWVGFLFALYWAGLERSNFKKLLNSLIGAAVGITTAYLLQTLPPIYGPVVLGPCIAGIAVMVFFQIMGWFAWAVNMTTMLFMTVATIPSIQAGAKYPKLLIALGVGALYFAIVVWIAGQVSRRFSAQPPSPSPGI